MHRVPSQSKRGEKKGLEERKKRPHSGGSWCCEEGDRQIGSLENLGGVEEALTAPSSGLFLEKKEKKGKIPSITFRSTSRGGERRVVSSAAAKTAAEEEDRRPLRNCGTGGRKPLRKRGGKDAAGNPFKGED